MHNVLLLGGGTIGSLIATLLSQSEDYAVYLGDKDETVLDRVEGEFNRRNLEVFALDATNRADLAKSLTNYCIAGVISALPYYCNTAVAEVARRLGVHYFDLTEDVTVARQVRTISAGANAAFVPQCGLAPGFISIAAHELMHHFEELDTVKLRVGALPLHPSNVLKYSLTWSTDGLINEYGNFCLGLEDGKEVTLMPLEGYETIEIDGLLYEAFNTSGGLGTLVETYSEKVRTLNYKTLRYPGHCEKMHFLMKDLKLNQDRPTLKRILENAIPKTLQDVVLIYVSVSGKQRGQFYEENYVKKIYPQTIAGELWSAIQITTASAVCAVVDLVLNSPGVYSGLVGQEAFVLKDITGNRFGRYYR